MNGIIWAILAGFGFGIFQTLNRKAGQHLDALRGTFILILISAVILILIAIATTDVSILQTAPATALLSFAIAGFIHFFVGWTLISVSQAQIGAARTGAVIGTMPLFGLVIDILFYQEPITVPLLLGVFLIVGGVIVVSLK